MSVALLFSPQGSQSVGMGRELAAASPAAASVYHTADATLGWAVSDARLGGTGGAAQRHATDPAVPGRDLARLPPRARRGAPLRGERLVAAFVAGHSVGEYAALVAAGTLELSDALRLVARRGALMAEARIEGGMVAVIGLDRAAVAAVVASLDAGPDLVVANDNAPGQVVISGRRPRSPPPRSRCTPPAPAARSRSRSRDRSTRR